MICISLTRADLRGGVRKNAFACALALALRRQYGGRWDIGPGGARWSAGGAERVWIIGPAGYLAMTFFDLHLPVPVRQVRLYCGMPAGARRLLARGAAVAGGSAALLVALGMAWVVWTAAGVAVAGACLAVTLRGRPRRVTARCLPPVTAEPYAGEISDLLVMAVQGRELRSPKSRVTAVQVRGKS